MRTDLNADLGEGYGDDDALLAVVTSANVACGSHAGDRPTMLRTCQEAARRGVAVGAHVSYDDRENFGRLPRDVAPAVLRAHVSEQLMALAEAAAEAGVRVGYVKPHGALYNRIVTDAEHARAVVEAVAAHDPSLALLGLPGSTVLRLAGEAGLRPVPEAFADRAYLPTGELVPRSQPGAVLHDPHTVAARVVRLVTAGEVVAVDGSVVTVEAASVCVHGDSPGAVAMARAVRAALVEAGVELGSFA